MVSTATKAPSTAMSTATSTASATCVQGDFEGDLKVRMGSLGTISPEVGDTDRHTDRRWTRIHTQGGFCLNLNTSIKMLVFNKCGIRHDLLGRKMLNWGIATSYSGDPLGFRL